MTKEPKVSLMGLRCHHHSGDALFLHDNDKHKVYLLYIFLLYYSYIVTKNRKAITDIVI